jgi:cytochrome P450
MDPAGIAMARERPAGAMGKALSAEVDPVRPGQPPGPRGLPWFGCLNGLLRNPMQFWSSIAGTYGGVARVPLKGRHVYLVSDPALLYELLVTNRHRYRKNTRYSAAVETFGEGLLLAEGACWKRQRQITQPSFKSDYALRQVPEWTELTLRFLDHWHDGDERCVDAEFLRLSQRLAGYCLMGPRFASIEERFTTAAEGIKANWPLPPRSVVALLVRRGKSRQAGLRAAIAAIDACLYEFLATHRQRDFEGCGVLESIAATSRAQGVVYDDRALRDQLLTLFFAGHETSATTLTWLQYLLWKHPRVRERMQAEVTAVLGNRLATPEDLGALEFTERVIYETLRLYSPIHSISRVAVDEDTLGGYRIPAGSMIYVSLYATHRLPELWPEPDTFDPERFEPGLVAARPRFAFIPFAAGHRNCIGGSMAMIELKLVAALVAQRFTLDLVKGHRVEAAAGTTMHPRFGMRMSINRV